MNVMKWSRTALAVCAIAAAAACSNDTGDARTEGAGATGDDAPITVAGCLQKGSGSDFILTRINEPTQSAGSGAAAGNRSGAAGDVVEREQLRSAAGAYRVEADDDLKLDGLVGKEVRIVGTIEDNMDLPRAGQSNDRVEVKEGDLYLIEAESATTLNEVCRGGESPAAATTGVTR